MSRSRSWIPRWLIIGAVSLSLLQCKKKEIEPQLPPETTIGAMTFGCKIDGKVFAPRDGRGQLGLYVQYVYMGPGRGGGYYLNIPAVDWKLYNTMSITTDSLLLEEGKTYLFMNRKGNAQASYFSDIQYDKLDQDNGEMIITRFDPVQRIVAGRFSFIGTNRGNGKKINVTDGRFDVKF